MPCIVHVCDTVQWLVDAMRCRGAGKYNDYCRMHGVEGSVREAEVRHHPHKGSVRTWHRVGLLYLSRGYGNIADPGRTAPKISAYHQLNQLALKQRCSQISAQAKKLTGTYALPPHLLCLTTSRRSNAIHHQPSR